MSTTPNEQPTTTYKGHEYYQDEHGVWVVKNPAGDLFVVALDDSKSHGVRTFDKAANSENACRAYIDWVTA